MRRHNRNQHGSNDGFTNLSDQNAKLPQERKPPKHSFFHHKEDDKANKYRADEPQSLSTSTIDYSKTK